MTIYYAGAGGSDGANGTSYVTRKLTLSGVEAIPVVAGDTVYCAPGVYRETLTVGVSGSSGSPIVYVADVDGSHTDSVGGPVRITGSDNDQTATRTNCITATSRNFRTFRGFAFDTSTGTAVALNTACGNWFIEDCYFGPIPANVASCNVSGTGTNNTIRRCIFLGGRASGLAISHSVTVDNSAHLVENCLFCGFPIAAAILISRVGGFAIKNCTFLGCEQGIRTNAALTVGQTVTVNNCTAAACNIALQAVTAVATNEELTENYNALFANATDRTNVSTGANSNTFPPLFAPSMLLSGFRYPWNPFDLSQWSPLRAIAGTNMSADGLTGIARPATDSKKSWGAIQYLDKSREVTTVRTGAASLKLADAGRHQMFVPTSNVSTVFSCHVRWETDYAGTKPQMVIKQPGQSATTVVATGSSGTWELLTTTLTPAASPGYVIVEFVSNNTATSGSYAVYVDDMVPSPASGTGGFDTFISAQIPFPVLAATGGVGASIFGGEMVR